MPITFSTVAGSRPAPLRVGEAFAYAHHGACDRDLVGHFGVLAGAGSTHQRDIAAHPLEHRLDPLESRHVAADHDGELGVARANFAA